MPIIKEYIDGLERHKLLHQRKNDDYAEPGKEFYNFEFTGEVMRHFEHLPPTAKSFMYLICTKMARFAILSKAGKAPQNESLQDTFDDWEIYIGLMRAWYERQMNGTR